MSYHYAVLLPLPGSSEKYEVVRCADPDHVAAVIRLLLQVAIHKPAEILIRVTPTD
jgi:hypothetical protein